MEDPEAPTVWIYPGPTFEHLTEEDLLFAHVDLWAQIAGSGVINGTDTVLTSITTMTWMIDDRGVEALTFQCSFSGDPTVPLERLALGAQAYWSPPDHQPATFRIDIDRIEIR